MGAMASELGKDGGADHYGQAAWAETAEILAAPCYDSIHVDNQGCRHSTRVSGPSRPESFHLEVFCKSLGN